MTPGTTKTVSNARQIARAVEYLTTRNVLVGIPSTTAGNRNGPINNAALLYIHDNGAPEAGIPARPVMAPGIARKADEINRRLRNAGKIAFEGRITAVEQQLNAVGLVAAQGIKEAINSNTPPPLRPSTLAKRRARGVTRTNTLVDTAQMRNAVTYVIRAV
jgi:hypothetical protein